MTSLKWLVTFKRSCGNWSLVNNPTPTLTKQFATEFKDFYSSLIDSTMAKTKYLHSMKLKSHIKKLSEYYTLSKYPLQGQSFILAYELLEKPENITEKKKHQAFTVACFMETFQAYFIIEDDLCDGGKIRNNKACWHQLPDVGISAINDISMLRSFTNEYLRLNIDNNIYLQVMDVINQLYFREEIGQYMDMAAAKSDNFENFTMEYYNVMQFNKSSYYTLIAPIQIALILSNNVKEESFHMIEDICGDLGIMVQIHNDFTEFLDLSEVLSGKSCTDIQERKCSWFAVKALQSCSTEQRRVFENNYGSYDPAKIKRIQQLFNELRLGSLYEKESNFRYNNYIRKVQNLPDDSIPSKDFFLKIFDFLKNYTDNLSRYFYI